VLLLALIKSLIVDLTIRTVYFNEIFGHVKYVTNTVVKKKKGS